MQDDERTRLLVDIEHLLKTPLLAAIRRSDVSLKRERPTRDDVLIIRALCARVWSQLSTFRTLSRLASNEDIQPNLVQLTVRELMSMLQNAVQDAQALDRPNDPHRFEVAADIDPEAMVEVDINLFEVALREVINNAVKYSDREGRIQLRVHSEGPQNLAISVSNRGVPMRPEEIGLLFERGYRSSEAVLRTAEGAGIGLYLVKAVMDAQNGTVLFECQGRTMTVKLELPVMRPSVVKP